MISEQYITEWLSRSERDLMKQSKLERDKLRRRADVNAIVADNLKPRVTTTGTGPSYNRAFKATNRLGNKHDEILDRINNKHELNTITIGFGKKYDEAEERLDRRREKAFEKSTSNLEKLDKLADERDREYKTLRNKSIKRNIITGIAGTGAAIGAGLIIKNIAKRRKIQQLQKELEHLKRNDPNSMKIIGIELALRKLGINNDIRAGMI